MSDSEISVPMEISAAALTVASRSSGRIAAKSVVPAFVRKPVFHSSVSWRVKFDAIILTHSFYYLGVRKVVDDYFCHLREMPPVPLLEIMCVRTYETRSELEKGLSFTLMA